MKRGTKETLIMLTLILATSALALTSKLLGLATWLEALSFITGAISVWLAVRENIWNFPIGILNLATFSVVFYRSHLFADAGLQIVYFVLTSIGWYMWLKGGKNRTRPQITHATPRELLLISSLVVVTTLGLWRVLHLFGGSASFWDSLTTSMSLGSQWLLNQKRLENWLGWILVDIIYVPLYVYKELYLTAFLYSIFLAMAVMGLRHWQRVLNEQEILVKSEVAL